MRPHLLLASLFDAHGCDGYDAVASPVRFALGAACV